MRTPQALIVVLILIFIILAGCQSRDVSVYPKISEKESETGIKQENSIDTLRPLWGYFNCMADLNAGTVTAVPNRTSTMHINATKPLNNSLGLSIAVQSGSKPSSGYFIINVSIKHPYPGNPQYTGFDVHGILLCTGGLTAGSLRIPGPNDPKLLNPDGWSRWWNPSEFTDPGLLGYVPGKIHIHPQSGPPNSNINPYKLFGDALTPGASTGFYKNLYLQDINGRAVFKTTSTNTRRYEIQFPVNSGPVIYFDYAIDASWALPSPNPPTKIPENFPMNANAPEAFIVETSILENTLASTPIGVTGDGQLKLSIDVWDWQAMAAGSYAGQVGDIRLYSPDIQFGTPTVKFTDSAQKGNYNVTVTGKPASSGQKPVLIEITAPSTSWKQSWQAAPAGQVAAYTIINVEVGLMTCTPDENTSCDNATPVELNSTVTGSICKPHDPSDFYVFTVPNGMIMDGTITLNNFDYGDSDLIVYKGCPGDPVFMSLTPGYGNEVLEVGNLESGFFYVSVLLGELAGVDVQPYKLTLNISKSNTECTTDNDNDYQVATTIGLKQSISNSVCAGGDLRDWYKFTVPSDKVAGGTIYVDNKSQGDINIRVYDVYPGTPSYWSTNTGNQDEMLEIPGIGPGTHYIEVYAQGTNPAGDRKYEIITDLASASFNCTSGDGNDSYITADPLGYTEVVDGTVCYPTDPDWYLFTVKQNKAVSGSITLSGALTVDNDLYLYSDPAQDPIVSSANAGLNDETITLNNLGMGTYYIKACARPLVAGGDQPYTLTMALVEKNAGNFDFKIHAHIITKSDGTSPATTENKVQADVTWANTFYSKWNGSFVLDKITYVKNSAWLAATSIEMYQCHSIYGNKSGPINVYYVNSLTDMDNAAAYAIMDCRYAFQTHDYTYIVMSDLANNGDLAHELAHATALLMDMYLLDYYTCAQLNQYFCPYPPNNSYCNPSDKAYGNLMYWSVQGWNNPWNYWLSDKNWQTPEKPIESQVENWTFFHTNYPNNF